MSETHRIELGDHQGETYLLTLRLDPSGENPDDWAATLHYRDAEKNESIEVAAVDNAHGDAHIHRYYRRGDHKEPVDWGPWEAMSRLIENWRTYAEQYAASHTD